MTKTKVCGSFLNSRSPGWYNLHVLSDFRAEVFSVCNQQAPQQSELQYTFQR